MYPGKSQLHSTGYQGSQGPKKSVLLYVRGGVGVLLPLQIAACEVQEWP